MLFLGFELGFCLIDWVVIFGWGFLVGFSKGIGGFGLECLDGKSG